MSDRPTIQQCLFNSFCDSIPWLWPPCLCTRELSIGLFQGHVISLVHGTLSVLFEAFCVKSYQGPLLEKPCRRHKEDHASHDTRVQMNYKKKNRHCFCFISQCTNRTMSEDGPLLSLILQVYQTHPDLSNGSMFSNRGSSFSPASCFMCSWRLSSWTSWWSLTSSWSSCTKKENEQEVHSVRVLFLISISNQPEQTSLCELVIFIFLFPKMSSLQKNGNIKQVLYSYIKLMKKWIISIINKIVIGLY